MNNTRGPLVSSIIIFFNAEKYLQEAIDSVISQSYSNWELILVDDGSRDGSTEIARDSVKRYPNKLVYVEHYGHHNRGMSASRNLGIYHSKGNHVGFLDADDIWLPHKLERQVEILETHPEAAAVFSPWREWLSWQEDREDHDLLQDLRVPPNRLIQPAQLVPLWLQGDSAIPGHCASLWRREAILSVGGFEDSFRHYYEDLVLLSKVHLEAPVFVMGECLSMYRQHEDSTCAILERAGEDRATKLTFYTWLEEYLTGKNIQNREIWEILQQQLFPFRYPTLHRLLRYVRSSKSQIKHLLKLVTRVVLPTRAYCWLKAQWR